MAKYLSNRQKNLKVGISSYTENRTVLEVIGKVGIGTINANAKLDVWGQSDLSGASLSGITTLGFFSDAFYLNRSVTLAPNTRYYSVHKQLTIGAGHSLTIGAGATIILDRFNNLDDVTADSLIVSGNVGIGTTNPTSKLHVVGDAYVSGVLTVTDINSTSDIRYKENIQPIPDAVEKVLQLNGVTFDWKKTKTSSAGVIAQEVEKILPSLISGDDPKTVNYNGIIGLLVEAVKELSYEIEMLKQKN